MITYGVLQIEFSIHRGDTLAVSRLVHLHHAEVAPVHKGDILTLVEALGISGLNKDHGGQDNRFFTDLGVLRVKWILRERESMPITHCFFSRTDDKNA